MTVIERLSGDEKSICHGEVSLSSYRPENRKKGSDTGSGLDQLLVANEEDTEEEGNSM